MIVFHHRLEKFPSQFEINRLKSFHFDNLAVAIGEFNIEVWGVMAY